MTLDFAMADRCDHPNPHSTALEFGCPRQGRQHLSPTSCIVKAYFKTGGAVVLTWASGPASGFLQPWPSLWPSCPPRSRTRRCERAGPAALIMVLSLRNPSLFHRETAQVFTQELLPTNRAAISGCTCAPNCVRGF